MIFNILLVIENRTDFYKKRLNVFLVGSYEFQFYTIIIII